jgi:hypothetical protein
VLYLPAGLGGCLLACGELSLLQVRPSVYLIEQLPVPRGFCAPSGTGETNCK